MFQLDNLTLILLGILVVLLLYRRFSTYPALVHPLLLGKQSEVSPVRQPGETGVYRSWATGQGTPLQVRPANTFKTVQHAIPSHPIVPLEAKGPNQSFARCILDTPLTDEALAEIVRLLPMGLQVLFPSQLNGTVANPTPILTLIPPTPGTSLPLLLLSLASHPATPLLVVSDPLLFTTAMTSSAHARPGLIVVHESILDDVVDQVCEDCEDSAGVLVIGDPEKEHKAIAIAAEKKGVALRWWEDIWDAAEKTTNEKLYPEEVQYSDIHSYYYTLPEEGATTSPVVKVTHMNVTAGIAGLLSLFPADKRPSAAQHDVVASAVRIDTPFGMTIALASIWSGAGFRLIGTSPPTWEPTNDDDLETELEVLTTNSGKDAKPTILFLSARHHSALLAGLHSSFRIHPLASLAARRKVTAVRAGHMTRSGPVEKFVLRKMRNGVLGGIAGESLRSVVVVGDAPPPSHLGLSHVLLSVPLTRLYSSPFSAGPIFVSHFYDLQSPVVPDVLAMLNITGGSGNAHCGPPASNVEVILKGKDTEPVPGDEGKALSGRLWIRGPAVLERLDEEAIDGWIDTGAYASVQTNGTFVVSGSL